MAKRKFALRSLFSGRAGRPAKDQEEEDWPSDSDGYNDAHPFDPSEVNRPPKLDVRTESELRKACAIIVENLKPSGHDLEDTRMQSDILVDNSDFDSQRSSSIHPGAASIPQPGATWYQEGSERSSQNLNPYSVLKSSDKRISAYRYSGQPPEYDSREDQSPTLLQAHQVQISRPIERNEMPYAPIPTQVVQSRARQYAETRVGAPLVNHSSSSMSNHTTSENGVRSGSTGNPNVESSKTSPALAAGAWVEEEMDKRRQAAQNESGYLLNGTDHAPSTNDDIGTSQNGVTSQTLAVTDNKSKAVDNASDAPSGTLNGPFEQPSFIESAVANSDGTDTLEPSSNETSLEQTNEEDHTPAASQPSSSARQSDSLKLAESYQRSIEEQAPAPAPTPAAIDNVAAAAQPKPRRLSKRLSKDPDPLSRSKSQGSKSGENSKALSPTSPVSPGLPKVPQTWPAPPKPRYAQENIPQIPPLPNKHQFDDTIVVKDFYQPAVPPQSSLRYSLNADKRPVRPGDVEAADFDSFMSVVKEPGKTDTDGVGNNKSPSPPDSPEQPAAAPRDITPPPNDAPTVTESLNSSDAAQLDEEESSKINEHAPVVLNNSATAQIPNGEAKADPTIEPKTEIRPASQPAPLSPASDRPQSQPLSTIHAPSQSQQQKLSPQEQRPAFSPAIVSPGVREQQSPVIVTSSRTSISASHSRSQSLSKKSPRGFKRILGKLGNADRSGNSAMNGFAASKRKVFDRYAPGAYVPGYGLNGGGIEEDDEWFEEQACAAPVVGFGRGW